MAQEFTTSDFPANQADEEAVARTSTEVSTLPASSAATLLPSPIAGAVSLITRSSSLYLRIGTFIGGVALGGARVTALTGLELSRAIVEGVLCRAGKDVAQRSTGELGRIEADGLLERSLATLHTTITTISFAASTGFHFSAAALSTANDISQQLLSFLDAMLGSTDSSRAIASIITLIRREFQNPATGIEGEKVGVADLMTGICGLALLQTWSQKLADEDVRNQRQTEVIWDVVTLNTSTPPVGATNNDYLLEGTEIGSETMGPFSVATTQNDVVLETCGSNEGDQYIWDDDGLEIELKERIVQSLPSHASVSITTSTTTSKVMVVEITGAEPPYLTPPAGVAVIEESLSHMAEPPTQTASIVPKDSFVPRYRVVYKLPDDSSKPSLLRTGDKRRDSQVMDVSNVGQVVSADSDRLAKERTISPEDFTIKDKRSPSRTLSTHLTEDTSTTGVLHAKSPAGTKKDPSLRSTTSTSKKTLDNVANQRKQRRPLGLSSSVNCSESTQTKRAESPPNKKSKSMSSTKAPDRKPSIRDNARNVLKKGAGSSISGIFSRDSSHENLSSASKIKHPKPAWGSATSAPRSRTSDKSKRSVPYSGASNLTSTEPPEAPQRGNPNYFSSRDLGHLKPTDVPRSSSRTSFVSIHEHRTNCMVAQTDTYSIHSADHTPRSPSTYRTQLRAESNIMRTRSEKTMPQTPASSRLHRRHESFVSSIYTLNTNNSETSLASLVLAPPCSRSAFDDPQALSVLARTGYIGEMFPRHHLVANISRFIRFASASYGVSFLRVMGITSATEPTAIDGVHHHEHSSFSRHTQLPADSILLSSFVDPQGGTDSSGHTETGVPMVHFVSLDHDTKAVVLTCRGTLGFEDVLTDLTCDFADLKWRGNTYRVHKGMLASAERLMSGGGGRVLASLQVALEEFPDYGLVLCGHSLGGGVTSLLAVLLSEPGIGGSCFVTASQYQRDQLLLPSTSGEGAAPMRFQLPPGRPIHVYAYGPPATMSPGLRLATRGLVTTIVNGQDLVPYLSLGTLHDLQSVALAFKADNSGAKGQVRSRALHGFMAYLKERWYSCQVTPTMGLDADDQWAYAALKVLRSGMLSPKLVPPGEVFCIESAAVLKRSSFTKEGTGLGRPATRTVLRYVRDVERKFGELKFGGSMLLDHSPGRYEVSLAALKKGVLGNN